MTKRAMSSLPQERGANSLSRLGGVMKANETGTYVLLLLDLTHFRLETPLKCQTGKYLYILRYQKKRK